MTRTRHVVEPLRFVPRGRGLALEEESVEAQCWSARPDAASGVCTATGVLVIAMRPTGRSQWVSYAHQAYDGVVRYLTVMLTLSGCDAVFGLQARPEQVDARPGCVRDDFSEGLASRWDVTADPGFAATVVDGQLHLVLADQRDGVARIQSAAVYDFTGGQVDLAVPRAINPAPKIENFLAVWRDPNNFYYLLVEYRGTRLELSAAMKRDGTHELGRAIAYDPTAHKRWRIRHEPGEPAMIVFETNADDGSPWLERHRLPALIDLPAARFVLMADAYLGGAIDPGLAIYDDFVFCPPEG